MPSQILELIPDHGHLRRHCALSPGAPPADFPFPSTKSSFGLSGVPP
ncbi:MAG: hypothetical protein IPJ13_20955 [Saprospiraceae bacterium]|nr:hypothetical protein [Saprospiraceae bacterium]